MCDETEIPCLKCDKGFCHKIRPEFLTDVYTLRTAVNLDHVQPEHFTGEAAEWRRPPFPCNIPPRSTEEIVFEHATMIRVLQNQNKQLFDSLNLFAARNTLLEFQMAELCQRIYYLEQLAQNYDDDDYASTATTHESNSIFDLETIPSEILEVENLTTSRYAEMQPPPEIPTLPTSNIVEGTPTCTAPLVEGKPETITQKLPTLLDSILEFYLPAPREQILKRQTAGIPLSPPIYERENVETEIQCNWFKDTQNASDSSTSQNTSVNKKDTDTCVSYASLRNPSKKKSTKAASSLTSEEGLKVLFEERCELFRHTGVQRIRHDIGPMKILLDPKDGSVRLLMRNEQVHKLCCNHCLTKEHKLERHSWSDKVWTWRAQDYSEGELKNETFGVAFKTKEQAKAFYEVFNQAKCNAELPKKAVAESTIKNSKETLPKLSEMFKKESGSWECKMCYVMNKKDIDTCVSCASPKNPSEQKSTNAASLLTDSTYSFSSKPPNESKFSFGMPPSTGAKPVENSTFAFGMPKESSTADSKPDGFKFTFGSTTTSTVSSTTSSATFNFGNSAAPSVFSFGTDPTTTSAQIKDDKSTFSPVVSQSNAGVETSSTFTPIASQSGATKSVFAFGNSRPNTPLFTPKESASGMISESKDAQNISALSRFSFSSNKPLENDSVFESAKSIFGSSNRTTNTSIFGTPDSSESENTSVNKKDTDTCVSYASPINPSEQKSTNAASSSTDNKFSFASKPPNESKFSFGMPPSTSAKPVENSTFAFSMSKESSTTDSKPDGFKFTFVSTTTSTAPSATSSATFSFRNSTVPNVFSPSTNPLTTSAQNKDNKSTFLPVVSQSNTSVETSSTVTPIASQSGVTKSMFAFGNSRPNTPLFTPKESASGMISESKDAQNISALSRFSFSSNKPLENDSVFESAKSIFGSSNRTTNTSIFGTPDSSKSENTSGACMNFSLELDNKPLPASSNKSESIQKEIEDNASDSPSSSEVEFISETKTSKEERELAEKLQLPSNFFTYKYVNDCSGCVGCDQDDINQRKEKENNENQAASVFQSNVSSGTSSNSSIFSGFNNPAGDSKPNLVFGDVTNSNTSSWPNKGPFKIGDVSDKTSSEVQSSPSQKTTTKDGSDDDDDSVVKNDVVPLPDTVEVKTGEENEEIKFCERDKLFK